MLAAHFPRAGHTPADVARSAGRDAARGTRAGVAAMLLAALSACTGGSAESDDIRATSAWLRYAPDGAVAAAYVTLRNKQVVDDRLVGASVPGATRVDVRTVEGQGDAARARVLDQGPVIDARNYLRLQPGGVHLALHGLRPEAGMKLQVTLHFLHAPDLEVAFPVRPTAGHLPAYEGADLRP